MSRDEEEEEEAGAEEGTRELEELEEGTEEQLERAAVASRVRSRFC